RQEPDQGKHATRSGEQREPHDPHREERDLLRRGHRARGGGRRDRRRDRRRGTRDRERDVPRRPDRGWAPGRGRRQGGGGFDSLLRLAGGARARGGARETVRIALWRVGRSDAAVPVYATAGAAGCDLAAAIDEPLAIGPLERVLVPTGIAIALP